jgi:hypothetical protein
MTYDSGYDNEPIGGSNPYYRCVHCKISDPQINGEINNHATTCEYRQKKQGYVLSSMQAYDLDYEIYDEELDVYTVVVMAREDLEKRDIKGALARLKVDADKLRTVNPKLYAIVIAQP